MIALAPRVTVLNMMKPKQNKKLLRSKRIEKLSRDIGADASKLELEINQLSSIDVSRMMDIHNRLSSDSYQLDVNKTSEKLLSFEQKFNKK
tara:strand:- start:6299 stop:6571 length:273 start_codon:yes stop_codon:yes gene_type:complete